MSSAEENRLASEPNADQDRRKFMTACGKFAIVTPPAITMLLSTSLTSTAIARSGGRGDGDRGDDRDNDSGRGDRDEGRAGGRDRDR
jgi:hypothetical protein